MISECSSFLILSATAVRERLTAKAISDTEALAFSRSLLMIFLSKSSMNNSYGVHLNEQVGLSQAYTIEYIDLPARCLLTGYPVIDSMRLIYKDSLTRQSRPLLNF